MNLQALSSKPGLMYDHLKKATGWQSIPLSGAVIVLHASGIIIPLVRPLNWLALISMAVSVNT
jgi:hypothetical protein